MHTEHCACVNITITQKACMHASLGVTHMHSMAVQHGMPCNYVKEREEDTLGGTEGVWLGSSSDDEREEDILGGTEGATGNPSLTKPAKIMNNC